ncbi:hypothetical protein HQ945_05535 [Phyllobacterium sp. BT25]|uniref:Uncharacterized protein n=1 Tax=Phyllobacterium pellucidum TaxID=2740464 RepID=A0A849VPM7_9HYPH|nr:hypothetical protein [Phyllobacterium pellucidum]NTS30709.1 hypothetical protein [Phyllobacterium pellucidum]
MTEITNKDKAGCAEREVKQRQRVYSRWVADGRRAQAFADRQIAVMQAIAEDYRAKADADDQAGRLF